MHCARIAEIVGDPERHELLQRFESARSDLAAVYSWKTLWDLTTQLLQGFTCGSKGIHQLADTCAQDMMEKACIQMQSGICLPSSDALLSVQQHFGNCKQHVALAALARIFGSDSLPGFYPFSTSPEV